MATNDKEVKETKTIEPAASTEHGTQAPHPIASHHIGRPALIVIAVVVAVLLLLIGTAAGFVGSRAFNQGARFHRIGLNGAMQGGARRSRHMMIGAYGKVTAVSDSDITLTDSRSGGSLSYKIDSTTTVKNNAGDTAKASDIKVGDTVRVRAASNTTDTTATTIIINPTNTPQNIR